VSAVGASGSLYFFGAVGGWQLFRVLANLDDDGWGRNALAQHGHLLGRVQFVVLA